MKRILLLAALFAASAFAALKPGYRYHRDVLPSDQVPADFETVMSNYLGSAGYVPSHVTNTETKVFENWYTNYEAVVIPVPVTNYVYDVGTQFVYEVTNIWTHEIKAVTNRETVSFYTEHWHTNNEVVAVTTNVFHEHWFTNFEAKVIPVYEPVTQMVYEVTNIVNNLITTNDHYDVTYFTYVFTNEQVIVSLETNIYTTVYETTNLYHETWATNNIIWTNEVHWITNNVIDTHEVHWITNNVVDTHENHWITNNVMDEYRTIYETTNTVRYVYEITNLYHEIWSTNNLVDFTNIYWLIEKDTYLTNWVYSTVTNRVVDPGLIITNREDHYVFTTKEVTNEVTTVNVTTNVDMKVTNFTTNLFANWYTDRISFTNGFERHEIDALNKRYVAYKRIVERYEGPYWTSDKFSHVFGTNTVPLFMSGTEVDFATFNLLSVGEGEEDAYDSLDNASSKIHLTGLVVPILDFLDADAYSEQQGYDCWPILFGFKVAGGYFGVSGSTTNYVTATTIPGIGDYLLGAYTIFGANYAYPDEPVLTFKGPEYTILHYCLRENGTLYWIPGADPDGLVMTLTSGKTGSVIPSSAYTHTTYTRNDGGIDVWTTNWTHYVSELADFNDLLHYGSIWTAEDVVTNRVFIETMEDAMLPYAFASYTNMAQAAGYARQAATDAQTVIDYMETADQKIAAAISTATADAIGAKNNAYSYMAAAQSANAGAQTAAGNAQTAQAKAEFAYDLVQTFTNWFYEAVNAGQVVTNVHNYYAVDQDARDRLAALVEAYDSSIAVTSTGVMTYPSAPKYRIPPTLKESGFSTTSSYHPNKTFTFGRIWRGHSNTGGDDTIEICYRNEDYPNAEFEEASNFCSYHLGLTILWNKNTGKWRVYRLYDSSNAWSYETEAYSTDLDHVWSGNLNSWTTTYTPTTAHVFVGTPQSIDLATQVELNAAVGNEATARADADSAEANARSQADTSIREDFAAADTEIRNTVAQVALDLTNVMTYVGTDGSTNSLAARVSAIEDLLGPKPYVAPSGNSYPFVTYYPFPTASGKVQVTPRSGQTSVSTQYRVYPAYGGSASSLYWLFSPSSTKTGPGGLELHYSAGESPVRIPEKNGSTLTGNSLVPGDLYWSDGLMYLSVTAVDASGAAVGTAKMKLPDWKAGIGYLFPGSIHGSDSDTTTANYSDMTLESKSGSIMGSSSVGSAVGHLKTAKGETAAVVWIPE